MTTKSLKKGFSLLEMLIYIGILVLMLGVIVEVVMSVAKSERLIRSLRYVENSAITSIERIGREVRAAESVNTTLSTFEAHPGVLVLDSEAEDGSPRTVEFYLENDKVMLREDGEEVGALTETQARVTDLKFFHISATSSQGIRTIMTIESGTSTYYRVETFYFSAIIR